MLIIEHLSSPRFVLVSKLEFYEFALILQWVDDVNRPEWHLLKVFLLRPVVYPRDPGSSLRLRFLDPSVKPRDVVNRFKTLSKRHSQLTLVLKRKDYTDIHKTNHNAIYKQCIMIYSDPY